MRAERGLQSGEARPQEPGRAAGARDAGAVSMETGMLRELEETRHAGRGGGEAGWVWPFLRLCSFPQPLAGEAGARHLGKSPRTPRALLLSPSAFLGV